MYVQLLIIKTFKYYKIHNKIIVLIMQSTWAKYETTFNNFYIKK